MQDQRTLASTLFHLVDTDVWDDLRAHMHERTFEPGEPLLEQGAIEPDFHVVVDGIASVSAVTPGGERRELGRLGFGECIGEMSLLTGDPASADVTAVTPVRTYAASQAQIGSLGDLRGRLIEALSTILAARLKHANERLLAKQASNVHVICCAANEVTALRALPAAMAEATGQRVTTILWGAGAVQHQAAFRGDSPDVRTLEDASPGAIMPLTSSLAHDFDHVLVLGGESSIHAIAADAISMLHVVRDEGMHLAPSAHASLGQVIALSSQPWTVPVIRRLTESAGRPVVAVIPPEDGDGNGRGQIARLARLLTGRRVGVAFGAGAAKGLAHLGVIRAFEELEVPIDVVSGCSIGAAIASGVAAGVPVDELTDMTLRIASKVVRPTLPLYSFLSNRGVKEEMKKTIGDRRIEDLDLPLALVAVDIFRRSEVTFTSGPLWPRMLASTAIPGVYPPSAGMGSYLVDGGILSPVPVRQCRELGAGIVIGVRLTATRTSPREQLDYKPSRPLAIENMIRAFEIMQNRISEISHEHADVNLEISIEGTGGIRDFRRGDEIAELGYRAAMRSTPAITEAMPYVRSAT